MIRSITVDNGYTNPAKKIDLLDPWKSGIFVNEVGGIGPVESNINMTDLTTGPGALFNSSRTQTRTLTLDLGYVWSYLATSVEETRTQTIYKYFPPGAIIDLVFETETKTVKTSGYVASNDITMYGEDAARSFITVECPDPYFYDLNPSQLYQPNIISSNKETIVNYGGDAPSGFTMNLEFRGPMPTSNIELRATQNSLLPGPTFVRFIISNNQVLNLTGRGLDVGDAVLISFVRGAKSITLKRGTQIIDLLSCINRDAYWPMLEMHGQSFSWLYASTLYYFSVDTRWTNAYQGL